MPPEYAAQDLQTLRDILCRLLDRSNLTDDEDIYLAGLTSIMVLPLLSGIEEAFNVSIPAESFLDARTLRALAEVVQAQRKG